MTRKNSPLYRFSHAWSTASDGGPLYGPLESCGENSFVSYSRKSCTGAGSPGYIVIKSNNDSWFIPLTIKKLIRDASLPGSDGECDIQQHWDHQECKQRHGTTQPSVPGSCIWRVFFLQGIWGGRFRKKWLQVFKRLSRHGLLTENCSLLAYIHNRIPILPGMTVNLANIFNKNTFCDTMHSTSVTCCRTDPTYFGEYCIVSILEFSGEQLFEKMVQMKQNEHTAHIKSSARFVYVTEATCCWRHCFPVLKLITSPGILILSRYL